MCGESAGKHDPTGWSALSRMLKRHPPCEHGGAAREPDPESYLEVLPGLYGLRWGRMWGADEDDGRVWPEMSGSDQGGM